MAGYPLQSLLAVRYFREDGAKNAARAADRRVVEARQELEARQRELARYRQWRPQEEERGYAAILGTVMRPDALAEFRTWLATLAEGEQQRLAAVSEAEDVLAGREREAAAGRQAVAAARKEAAKIEAHRSGRKRKANGGKIWNWKSLPRRPDRAKRAYRRARRHSAGYDCLEAGKHLRGGLFRYREVL